MKARVINGKRYNPQAANLIGEANGLTLYRKTTGEYFATENGEYIILKDDIKKTKEIARQVLSDKDFAYEFEIRNSDLVGYTLTMPKPIYDKVSQKANEEGKSMKELVTDILFDNLF